ncbi:MAG: hypothetical protein ACLFRU_00615 [Paracoccaceae bacterium]
MTRIILLLAATLALAVSAPAARADCFADYKAKRENGALQLHYGVAEIAGTCAREAAADELAPRLAAQGWSLLNVMSVFGPEGLEERKASAGAFYLRF